MATVITDNYVVGGGKRIACGTFTTSGTTGTIVTGLSSVDFIKLQVNKNGVVADQVTINTTLPAATGTIAYTVTNNEGGTWWALGI